MTALAFSRHAEARMSQRGLRPSDLDLILRLGSEIDGDIHDIYYLGRKDVERATDRLDGEILLLTHSQGAFAGENREREIHRRKRKIQRNERLTDRKLVVANGTVVTCYRSNRRDRIRMFRRAREGA